MLRLLFFVVPFAGLYVLGLSLGFTITLAGVIAAILATLIGVSLSVLFLAKPREQASESVHEWRNRDRTEDDIAEDAVIDDAAVSDAAGSDGAELDAETGR